VKSLPAVPPKVTSIDIFVGPESLVSRNGEINASAGAKAPFHQLKELSILLNVLNDIEQPSGCHTRPPKSRIFESRVNDILNASALRVASTRRAWFEQDNFNASILHSLGNISISASNIEHRSRWRKLLHHFENAGVPVTEPERNIFHLEAGIVAPLRVRNQRS